MWPFPKNRQFVDDLIDISNREPGAWKPVNEYRANLNGVDFWIANGRMFFQPCGSRLPSLRFFERRRLWRAYQHSHDTMPLAEILK